MVAGIDVAGIVDIGFVACIMLAIDAWEEIYTHDTVSCFHSIAIFFKLQSITMLWQSQYVNAEP